MSKKDKRGCGIMFLYFLFWKVSSVLSLLEYFDFVVWFVNERKKTKQRWKRIVFQNVLSESIKYRKPSNFTDYNLTLSIIYYVLIPLDLQITTKIYTKKHRQYAPVYILRFIPCAYLFLFLCVSLEGGFMIKITTIYSHSKWYFNFSISLSFP